MPWPSGATTEADARDVSGWNGAWPSGAAYISRDEFLKSKCSECGKEHSET